MLRDLHNNVVGRRCLSPVIATDDTPLVSQIIDLTGHGSVEFFILVGSVNDADATFQVLIEDGDAANLSDAAAVPDAFLLGVEGVAATPSGASFRFDSDNTVKKIGYIGPKRYVRVTITPTGNDEVDEEETPIAAAAVAVLVVLGHPRVGPKSTQ